MDNSVFINPCYEATNTPVPRDCCIPETPLRLWVIEYEVNGIGKGCAICKANDPHEAIRILEKSGLYNSKPSSYEVSRVEQVIVPPASGLMAEQVVTFEEAIKNTCYG